MIEISCGILMTISIYLILEKILYRQLFGIMMLSTTINLILLISSRSTGKLPAFISQAKMGSLSNPLPQALILTAIVIGFGLLLFLCLLTKFLKKYD